MPYADKEAARANARRWYAENRAKYVKWRRLQYERYKKEVVSVVNTYKENHPCCDCGKTYPHFVMDFDHIEGRGKKSTNVSDMIRRSANLTKILAEIEKCEVVCANCHRIRSHTRSKKRRTK